MSELIFPAGFYFNHPSEKAPDYVIGSISIRPDVFEEWLKEQKPNDKGYVKLQVLKSKKDGKPYVSLDTYVSTQPRASEPTAPDYPEDEIDPNSVPF